MAGRGSILIGAVFGALATALLGGIAWAAIPTTPGGVIQGCYDSGGNVKVVETGQPCPPKYTPFQWNQQGIQGVPGKDGTNGTNGTNGDQWRKRYERIGTNRIELCERRVEVHRSERRDVRVQRCERACRPGRQRRHRRTRRRVVPADQPRVRWTTGSAGTGRRGDCLGACRCRRDDHRVDPRTHC